MGVISLCLLAAADSLDPLAGGSGWVGAGLLGLVLCWLLFRHLPEKDKQLAELVSKHEAHVASVLAQAARAAADERADYRAELAAERALRQEQSHATAEALASLSGNLEALKNAIREQTNRCVACQSLLAHTKQGNQ